MTKRNGIKVTIWQHRLGYCLLRPVNDRYATAFRNCVVENGGPAEREAYVEHLEDLQDSISPKAYRDLRDGWGVTCIMDPWVVGHCYGWDAHTIVEKGGPK